jgi:hypothetical protein
MPEHEYCQLVLAHHETVGQLKADMNTVKNQTTELFSVTRRLETTSMDNKNGIQNIQHKLDNGINMVLENIQDEVTRITESNVQERVRGATERMQQELNKKDEQKQQEALDENTIKMLKADSWVIKLLSMGVKTAIRWVFAVIVILVLAIAGITNAMWAAGKINIFKEYPGQIQGLVKEHYHSHTLPDGRILFHANDPNAAAFVLDPRTKEVTPAPQMRTEDGIKQ